MSEQERKRRPSPSDPSTWSDALKLRWLLAVREAPQRDLADLLGVSESFVSYLLSGRRNPTPQQRAILRRWSNGFAYSGEVAEQLVEQNVESDQASAVRPSRRRKDIAA